MLRGGSKIDDIMLTLKEMNKQGFTIVELLIVIVVIAILAGVSIVAYAGMSDKAYAVKLASSADYYVKIFNLYKVQHGDYPVSTDPDYGLSSPCLGEKSNYPATGVFREGECSSNSYGAAENRVNESFNNLLKEFSSIMRDGSFPAVDLWNGMYPDEFNFRRGIVYFNYGSPHIPYVTYLSKRRSAVPQR